MEGPPRLLFYDVVEVEAFVLISQARVSCGEKSDEEVDEQDHAGEKVEPEEDLALPPLLTHGLKGELSEHPGEEGDEGLIEGRKLGDAEENAAREGEGEDEKDTEKAELEDDLAHVGEDGEEGAEEGVEAELEEDLEPDAAPEEGEAVLGNVIGFEGDDGDEVVEAVALLELKSREVFREQQNND